MNLSDYQKEIHAVATSKGWWDSERSLLELFALMHSELSEAVESWRNGEEPCFVRDGSDKPEGWGTELADCIIRILDVAEHFGLNMDGLIRRKMLYNLTREHRQGGKLA